MQGFIQRRIPLFVRRMVTMIPAFIVIAIQGNDGDVSRTLVVSQVVLSFGIPFALIPLVMFTSRRDVMGVLVNARDHDRRGDRGRDDHHGSERLPACSDLRSDRVKNGAC
jgi:Mn2+/Fe2+ NRAMP family transporter